MLVESAILKPVQQETVTDIIGVIVIADDVATSIDGVGLGGCSV